MAEPPEIADPAPPGLQCVGCRYDVGGLPMRGRCPECGRPVAGSLATASLTDAHPFYARKFREYGNLVLAGDLILLASFGLFGVLIAAYPDPLRSPGIADVGFFVAPGLLVPAAVLFCIAGFKPREGRWQEHDLPGYERRLSVTAATWLCIIGLPAAVFAALFSPFLGLAILLAAGAFFYASTLRMCHSITARCGRPARLGPSAKRTLVGAVIGGSVLLIFAATTSNAAAILAAAGALLVSAHAASAARAAHAIKSV
ncbi:MAG: hypothetical protein AAFX79_08810 [Planctomycetota bacterium]